MSEIKIKPAPIKSKYEGQFYVIRRGKPSPRGDKYLHSGGYWRDTALNDKGDSTGYFPSEEAAQAALEAALAAEE